MDSGMIGKILKAKQYAQERDRIEFTQGMDITFVTTAPDDEQGYALLLALGMPFRNKDTAATESGAVAQAG